MSPKKAIVIVSILFLIVIMVFVFLYLDKPTVSLEGGLNSVGSGIGQNDSASSTSQKKPTTVEQKIEAIETKTNQQVQKIVEQGTTATGGITVDAQSKIDEAVNQEIIEKLKLRTPEQLKADEQRRIDQEKLDQQINQQIKDQLQNK